MSDGRINDRLPPVAAERDDPNTAVKADPAAHSKVPRIAIKQIVLKSGQEICVNEGDSLLVVGPNNAGKSAFLRDIKSSIENPINSRRVIVASTKLEQFGSWAELIEWLRERGAIRNRQRSSHEIMIVGGRQADRNSAEVWWKNVKNGLHSLTDVFLLDLDTEGRLTAANSQDLPAFTRRRGR